MDMLYAITLIVAMAAGALALLMNIFVLLQGDARMTSTAPIWRVLHSQRVAAGALVLGALSLAISVVVHSRWGHGPATAAPMDLRRLIAEHEAFPTVTAILALGLALIVYRRWRQGP